MLRIDHAIWYKIQVEHDTGCSRWRKFSTCQEYCPILYSLLSQFRECVHIGKHETNPDCMIGIMHKRLVTKTLSCSWTQHDWLKPNRSNSSNLITSTKPSHFSSERRDRVHHGRRSCRNYFTFTGKFKKSLFQQHQILNPKKIVSRSVTVTKQSSQIFQPFLSGLVRDCSVHREQDCSCWLLQLGFG